MTTKSQKRRRIFNANNGLCFYCKTPINITNRTIDHWIDQIDIGRGNKYNILIPACKKCNNNKSKNANRVFKIYLEFIKGKLKSVKALRKIKGGYASELRRAINIKNIEDFINNIHPTRG